MFGKNYLVTLKSKWNEIFVGVMNSSNVCLNALGKHPLFCVNYEALFWYGSSNRSEIMWNEESVNVNVEGF